MSWSGATTAPRDLRAGVQPRAGVFGKLGGRLVFTAFEVDPERTAGLPGFGADPVSDYRPLLTEAGFNVDVYEEVPGWSEPLTAAYSALVAAGAALEKEMGEVATRALILELSITLQQKPYQRRVFVAATRR